MAEKLKPREQGDLGEAAAIAWLIKVGARTTVPLFHSPHYDLIAEIDGRLVRVQVKTCRRLVRGRYSVQIATNGGNQSWTGLVKYFNRSHCDALFILVADGRRWFIPASAVEGRRAINVGGPKYSDYEIDPDGAPAFAMEPPLESAADWGS